MTNPKLEQLTPENSQLIIIDHQPQMAFGVASIDRQTLKNNTVALAKAAKLFGIPTIITTVETESFSGHALLSCSTGTGTARSEPTAASLGLLDRDGRSTKAIRVGVLKKA